MAFIRKGNRVERDSRKLIRLLEKDGWVLERVTGNHHTFKHPDHRCVITLSHPRKDLSIGQVQSIYRLAGWES
jgi:predicted RNA binding protein YcfA (HicA-like mRNA interferase family)